VTAPCATSTASVAIATGAPRLRSLPDRLRQVALYEAGGLVLISPLFALAAGISPYSSGGLLAVLALIVAVWNGVYSSAFDWAEGVITGGRTADRRPAMLRAAHAVTLEAGAVVVTTPVIAVWTGGSWNSALVEDVGLTLAYAAYAFVFGFVYDRLFPINSDVVSCGGFHDDGARPAARH
jgi:uncharacterized membrane protein